LDGFPRNVRQAKFLIRKISKYGYDIDHVIHLNLTEEQSIERLLKRNRKAYEGSTESHDTIDKIKSRLESYSKFEAELLRFFGEKNMVVEIDGMGTIDDVNHRILNGLKISP
jgi:adenylate kinase